MGEFAATWAADSFFTVPGTLGRVVQLGKTSTSAFLVWLAVLAFATVADAAVIVFDNRMEETVSFQLTALKATDLNAAGEDSPWQPFGKPITYQVASGDVLPIPVLGVVQINFGSDPPREYVLDPNTVCFFAPFDGQLDLQQIGFTQEEGFAATQAGSGADENRLSKKALEEQQQLYRDLALCPTAVIPVKILVDENEVARPELWQKRLSDRLEAASKIFERHARIRFEVVAFDTWNSNDALTEFKDSLSEFERKASPYPAQLAIGFTSQYKQPEGTTRLGGTFGPFRTHLLMREWHNHISDAERLEVLVHELGHYFGATHSLEPNSVMRPKLGDRLSRREGFRIRFDPLNTLILYLVGEEIRYRDITQLAQVSPPTKSSLRNIYTELARGFPEDDAAGRFLRFLYAPTGRDSRVPPANKARNNRVLQVVDAVREAASAQLATLPTGDTQPPRGFGDQLTEVCLKAAATEAEKLPKSQQVEAFLLGFGLAMDSPGQLRRNPFWMQRLRGINRPNSELLAVPAGGPKPTIDGREDLLLHFAYSAAITALMGPSSAEMAGLVKELSDARGPSGFSFDDYAADLAGIALARRLKVVGTVPSPFAENVTLADVVPSFEGLPSGLDADTLQARYGVPDDERFKQQRSEIVARIMALPVYSSNKFGTETDTRSDDF
ncbi:Uncharacterized protein SCF082_LOCUS38857 [Durusdinium trenchii]|uniref:Uncharacterized protein n=1 Tax=Durusdinium trenchii TaxID=1381693 RepID=A0ABP0PHE8_9DINO